MLSRPANVIEAAQFEDTSALVTSVERTLNESYCIQVGTDPANLCTVLPSQTQCFVHKWSHELVNEAIRHMCACVSCVTVHSTAYDLMCTHTVLMHMTYNV